MSYRFEIANNQLFAIESSGGGYGTESGVLTTVDAGDSWKRFSESAHTFAISGNGSELLALTTNSQVWRQTKLDASWSLVATLPDRYNYSLLVDRAGRFLVGGNDVAVWYAQDGTVLHRFTASPAQFGPAYFVGDDQQQVLIEANAYSVFVLDLATGNISPWSKGLQPTPANHRGPGNLRPFGNRYLLSRMDGVFEADGLSNEWRLITDQFAITEALDTELCRDLIEHDPKSKQWLVASNAGVHLMEGDKLVRTVLPDSATAPPASDDTDLILQIVPFQDYYFISFARLKNGEVGVRLNRDLTKWKTMRGC